MTQTILAIPQLPADPSSSQPAADTREQLTALWTLRLVLKTPAEHKLLASQHTADDVLAVIGPWIEWPVAMQREFIEYLYGNETYVKILFGDPEDGEESVVECKVPAIAGSRPKRPPAKRIAPNQIDWQALDWSELATPFCEIYQKQRGRLLKLFNSALRRLEQTPIDPRDDLVRNLTLLAELLELNAVEQAVLRFYAVATETGWLRKLLGTFRFEGLQKAAALLGGLLDLPPGQVVTVLRRDGVLRQCGLLEFGRHVHDLEDLIQLGGHLREVIGFPHDSIAALMAHFLADSPPGQLRREDYPHLRQPHQDLTDLLAGALRQRQAGVNVLLYGPPGTGKTEFARLLAAEIHPGYMPSPPAMRTATPPMRMSV